MDFVDIEDAIIAKLREDVADLRTVETYAGQLDDEIGKLTSLFPAAFVVYEDSQFQWIDGPSHQETAKFSVLVATKDPRGQKELRKGDAGAYALSTAVLAALTNEKFGLQMEKLRPTRRYLVFLRRGVAAYAIEFQTSFDKAFNWE